MTGNIISLADVRQKQRQQWAREARLEVGYDRLLSVIADLRRGGLDRRQIHKILSDCVVATKDDPHGAS